MRCRVLRRGCRSTACSGPRTRSRRCAGSAIRNVADLLRLPRAGFAARFGPRLLDELDEGLGRRPAPRRRHVVPERFDERLELPAAAELMAGLQPAFEQLLGRLEAFLRARASGIGALRVDLLHRGQAPTRLSVTLARMAGDAGHLRELVRERLAQCRLAAPVEALRLRSGMLLPLTLRDAGLFERGRSADPEATARLLDRLRARLGRKAVFSVSPVPEHRPERAWRIAEPGAATPVPLPWPAARPARPLWMLAEPQPLGRLGRGARHRSRAHRDRVVGRSRRPARLLRRALPRGRAPLDLPRTAAGTRLVPSRGLRMTSRSVVLACGPRRTGSGGVPRSQTPPELTSLLARTPPPRAARAGAGVSALACGRDPASERVSSGGANEPESRPRNASAADATRPAADQRCRMPSCTASATSRSCAAPRIRRNSSSGRKSSGTRALALTDECSLAGIVRAHAAARETGLALIAGSEFTLADGLQFVCLAASRRGYAALSRLITRGRRAGAERTVPARPHRPRDGPRGLPRPVAAGGRSRRPRTAIVASRALRTAACGSPWN